MLSRSRAEIIPILSLLFYFLLLQLLEKDDVNTVYGKEHLNPSGVGIQRVDSLLFSS